MFDDISWMNKIDITPAQPQSHLLITMVKITHIMLMQTKEITRLI